MTETDQLVAYQGEVMLLGWAETNSRGRTVTFQLGDEGDAHPFREHKVRSGKIAGQRYMMVLVEIGDDEKPVVKTPSQLAYMLCKDEQFWHFANERSFVTVDSEEAARSYILEACGVDSRSRLDTNLTARAHWEALVWQPFQKYRETVNRSIL